MLANAGPSLSDIGGEDGVEREQAAAKVGDGHAGADGRLAAMAGDGDDAGHRLRHQVEARPIRPGTRLAETRNARIDQARLDRLQRVVADPKSRDAAGAIVLDDDVRAPDQLVERLAPGSILEIEGYAALVPIEVHEPEAVGALELKPMAPRL